MANRLGHAELCVKHSQYSGHITVFNVRSTLGDREHSTYLVSPALVILTCNSAAIAEKAKTEK